MSKRYIDANLLLAQCRRNPLFEKTEKDKGMLYIERSIIDNTPTADVVEVVRCKDCIYYKANSCFNRQWDFESSTEIPMVRDCDFCSYGERKAKNEG